MPFRFGVAVYAVASLIGHGHSEETALPDDDECVAAASPEEREQCALSALQHRTLKVTSLREPACAGLDDPRNAKCKATVEWVATGGGKWDPHASVWFKDMLKVTGIDLKDGTIEDFQKLYYCSSPGGYEQACGTPPCSCSKPPCGICEASTDEAAPADDSSESAETENEAGAKEGETTEEEKEEDEEPESKSKAPPKVECARLDDPRNAECKSVVEWAANGGGKWDTQAPNWFKDMNAIAGVDYKHGSVDDFQKLYYCSPPGGKACGTPPCSCSKPPCDHCVAGQKQAGDRKICSGGSGDSIACRPPATAMDYKGGTWPTLTVSGKKEEVHIIAIGDWGGMDGSLNPIEGRPHVIAYGWGARPGPSVFPRTRWDKPHEEELCTHKQFIACFNSKGQGDDCPEGCGYVAGVDDQPQQLVAAALKERAAKVDPDLILNVGDNFYWGGIEKNCGTPMDQISWTAHHQFDQIYESIYQGPGLTGKPWYSVLGNHDWGGRVFNNGWDQQIAYTWASDRWIMPAPYYMASVEYPDMGFTIDLFMTDSNFIDAMDPEEDPEHNICGAKHNKPDADCSPYGGPASIESCPQFFQDLWSEQKVWMMEKLSQSKATWQIMVTHFPCGEDGENQAFYRKLHQQYGLDLLVTGHRHDQEIWLPEMTHKNFMGGLTCIVTGGGGGITSEATPDPEKTEDWYGEAQYGFYDLKISKDLIQIMSINWNGTNVMNATVRARS